MAKRTFSHRNAARRLTESLRKHKEKVDRIRDELTKYLNGENVSLNKLIKDIASTEETVNVRYDRYIIRIGKDGSSVMPRNSSLEEKLSYLMLNLPPTPKSFELFYESYTKLENEEDKKMFAREYFETLPKYVKYKVPVGNGLVISFVKKDDGIKYKKTNETLLGKRYDKKIVLEILKYVNAHSR